MDVDVSSRAVRAQNGGIEFILSSNKDVTSLKVIRDAKLLEARYGQLLESTPDGILIANSTGRIVLANDQAERLFGYERGELTGQISEMLVSKRCLLGRTPERRGFTARTRA